MVRVPNLSDLCYNNIKKYMANKNNWIQGAIKRPGALTAKAKAAGMSISQYCAQANISTQSKRQCNLVKTLKSFNK